ncbi:MAG: hypothetical protein HYZ17_12490 [Betaproteobacteria bacterium]|nr:hypothetical protein [Betaproteobacteria bacterium]
MNTRTLHHHLAALALATTVFTAPSALAWQDLAAANMAFDAQFNAQLGQMQAQNNSRQQQLWQHHLQVNGPRLQAQYRQLLASGRRDMSFEQFAYWDLMTAAGTNVQGALDAQRRQFEGNQAAHRTVQSGYASYNAGWANNSARTSAALANYSNTAIRGNSHYRDPYTGQTYNLPHSAPAGQVQRSGHDYYVQDQSGTYHRWVNNGWQRLDSVR